jgi:hypothetical protein
MNILAFYKKGIREASGRPKVVLILWAANAVFAVPAYVLFASLLASALGPSGAAAGLMKTADMNILFEVLVASGRPFGMLFAALLVLVLFYFLASIFLAGGILGVLLDGPVPGRTGRTFFGSGAAYYGRFLRLSVYSLGLWLPAAALFGLASAAVGAATAGSTKEQLSFYLTLALAALALFLVFLIKMIMDYARIRIAAEDTDKVLPSLLGSARFVFKRPGLTLGLYYLLGLTGLAIFGAWRLLNSAIPAAATAAVLAAFVLAQVFIAGRGWLKVAYQSAQLAVSRTHRPEGEPKTAEANLRVPAPQVQPAASEDRPS